MTEGTADCSACLSLQSSSSASEAGYYLLDSGGSLAVCWPFCFASCHSGGTPCSAWTAPAGFAAVSAAARRWTRSCRASLSRR